MSGRSGRPNRSRALGRARDVVRGLLLLGTGRVEGLACFEGSRDGFLAGLSPPVGFLLVIAAILLVQRPTAAAACLILLLLCAVLLPPVVSHAMARLWRCVERWQRYATASIWSNWLVLPAYVPAMLLAAILLRLGVDQAVAVQVMMLLLGGYLLWVQWFITWKGLAIGRLQAALTVLVVTVAPSLLLGAAMQPLLTEVIGPQGHPQPRVTPGAPAR